MLIRETVVHFSCDHCDKHGKGEKVPEGWMILHLDHFQVKDQSKNLKSLLCEDCVSWITGLVHFFEKATIKETK